MRTTAAVSPTADGDLRSGWPRVEGGRCLDDDIFELRDVGEPAHRVDGELKNLVARLPAARLIVPPPPGCSGSGSLAERRAPSGRKPSALPDRAISACCKVRRPAPDLSHAGQARERILQIDDRVVAQKGFVVTVVVGVKAPDQQDVGADFLDTDALGLNGVGQLRQGAVDRVLDQRDRGIESRCQPRR